MRFLLTVLALSLIIPEASALGRRRRAEPVYCQPQSYSPVSTASPGPATDALDELNRLRAMRGLYPLIRDDGLTQGALSCATYRAQHGIRGHVTGGLGDFAFIKVGSASVGGCSAVEAEWGFLACEQYTRQYRYAGAASVVGPGGIVYNHLFLK